MTLFRSARDRSTATPSGDWLWGGVGLTMASASAAFATYMIATAPSEVTGSGSKDWNIFAHYDRRAPSLAQAERQQATSRAVASNDPGAALDPEPTGSIAAGPAVPGGTVPAQPGTAVAPAELHDFFLRQMVGDKALIEHRRKLTLVEPGSVLDDAGEVLSIERRNGGWVVKTAAGIIRSGT